MDNVAHQHIYPKREPQFLEVLFIKVAMTYSPTRLLTEQARQFLQRKVTRSVAQSHRVGRDKQGLSNLCSTIGPR